MPLKPTREQLKQLGESPLDSPVVMLNLLKFAPGTAGEGGGTGQEGYQRYADEMRAILERTGAKVLWHGRADSVVIGGEADDWDAVALVEYRSRKAFLQMVGDPGYEKTGEIRTNALLDSRLIATTELFRAP